MTLSARPAAPRHRSSPPSRARRGRLGLMGGVAGAALVLSPLPASADPVDAPERTAPAAPVGAAPELLDPTQQSLDWRSCFPDGAPVGLPPGGEALECADYVVPRDWDAPGDGLFLSIAVSRLPATGHADGSVLTNPGGPGGPGLTLPLLFADAGRTRITDVRDVVGIDVRGTGASTNVTCSNATSTQASLDPRDRSKASTDLLLDTTEAIARACQADPQNLSPVISTEQTVRDLDLLRQLLGEKTVDWVGYSGGTWLGAAYAQAFPDRVGRFVLDANTEFTSPWQNTFELQPLGFQRRWEGDFLPWAAKHDQRFGLGAAPEEVDAAYERVRAGLAAVIPGGGSLVDSVVISSMYSKASFSDLADFLAEGDAALAGDALPGAPAPGQDPAMAALARRAQQRVAQVEPSMAPPMALDAFDATFLDITCNDTPWTGDRASLLAFSSDQGEKHPLVGWSTLAQPCAFWDRPASATLAPRTGKGVPPVLMVQNENDPATPVEGARIAREQFAGAKLLEVENEGDHTIYPGNPCVDTEVEDFLLGQAEAADSTCQGVGLPEPSPAADDALPGAAPSPSATALPEPSATADASPSRGTPLQRVQRWDAMAGLDTIPQP